MKITTKVVVSKAEILDLLNDRLVPKLAPNTEVQIEGYAGGYPCVPAPLNPAIFQHLKENNRIGAIKEVRTQYNCSLKEAKDFVESILPCGFRITGDDKWNE